MMDTLRKQLSERLAVTDLERDIIHMEADLNYHRKKTRILEETLQEQQHLLARLQRRKKQFISEVNRSDEI